MPSPTTIRRRSLSAALAVCVAAGAFLGVSALAGGDGSATRRGTGSAESQPSAVAAGGTAGEAAPAPLARYTLQSPHVLSAISTYSVEGAVRGQAAAPPPETPPVPAAAFKGPIARYRTYSREQLADMDAKLAELESALAAEDRTGAERAWRLAYADYLRLGAVYLDGKTGVDEQVSKLNAEIDGNANALPGGVSNPRFTGLHRIEYGLWSGQPPGTLLAAAQSLRADVQTLAGVLPRAPLTPAEYARRAHEILEDALHEFLNGADVPASGEGVLATDASLQATEEVVGTLAPVLGKRVIPTVRTELDAVRSVMDGLAAAHGGRLPSRAELSQEEAESLDGTLGGALEALSQLPGALETEAPPKIPAIPARDFRTDPHNP